MSAPPPRPRPGILEITPYVGGRSEVEGAARAIKLSSNESPLGPSPRAMAAYAAEAERLHRYPDGHAGALRRALGDRFGLAPDRIVCGAGSDELIALLIRAYAGPGDEVLYSAHGFLMYKLSALAAGAHPVAAPERELRADVDALLARVTSRTRLVFIASPNNPTGSYLPADELERLHRGLPDGVILAVDSAYAEYVRRNDYDDGSTLASRTGNVVMLRTFSKLFGLAALRLGWMYGPPAIVDVINRVRGPFNVGTPAQVAGIAALRDEAHQEAARLHNERWLPWLARELAALGLTVHPSAGNFLLVSFAREAGRDADAATAFLAARGIIPRQMGAYGLPESLRVTVGLEDENRAVVGALREFVAR
ncbi:MAG TPA: histidinol-phosphate transaminase [Geminicoccaceae bacterium]|nr:histidinol-phosphate transaminase [Geminicoccaceae bacterium]